MKSTISLVTGLLLLVVSSGCITKTVPIRYTPLIQARRLADEVKPEIVLVEKFQDARSLNQSKGVGLGGAVKVTFDLEGDVPDIVRSAFVDALIKSGFVVPMQGEPITNSAFRVSGKVLRFTIGSNAGWETVTVIATVEVEINLDSHGSNTTTFVVRGMNKLQRDTISFETDLTNGLELAVRDCVKKFLQDERFIAFLKDVKRGE